MGNINVSRRLTEISHETVACSQLSKHIFNDLRQCSPIVPYRLFGINTPPLPMHITLSKSIQTHLFLIIFFPLLFHSETLASRNKSVPHQSCLFQLHQSPRLS
jgi:hypothetical protein